MLMLLLFWGYCLVLLVSPVFTVLSHTCFHANPALNEFITYLTLSKGWMEGGGQLYSQRTS